MWKASIIPRIRPTHGLGFSSPLGKWIPTYKPLAGLLSTSTPMNLKYISSLQRDPDPTSNVLTDSYKRQHTYLRIAVTERCNLRCIYCMPADGLPLSPPKTLLTTDEIIFLSRLFVCQGVNKIRLTGGEPSIRPDIIDLIRRLGELRETGLQKICMTSNGVALERKLPSMVEAGLTHLNLSLDTLKAEKFEVITRRKGLDRVLRTLDTALDLGLRVKVNVVPMKSFNDTELDDLASLAEKRPIEVRFIEFMPFPGNPWSETAMIPWQKAIAKLKERYPSLSPSTADAGPHDTAVVYKSPSLQGSVGFISSLTSPFCSTCNRLRITCDGFLKTCLFDNGEANLRDVLRDSVELGETIEETENRLLGIIGVAVRGKARQRAGLDLLPKMANRPIAKIGG